LFVSSDGFSYGPSGLSPGYFSYDTRGCAYLLHISRMETPDIFIMTPEVVLIYYTPLGLSPGYFSYSSPGFRQESGQP